MRPCVSLVMVTPVAKVNSLYLQCYAERSDVVMENPAEFKSLGSRRIGNKIRRVDLRTLLQ